MFTADRVCRQAGCVDLAPLRKVPRSGRVKFQWRSAWIFAASDGDIIKI
jgi:hypothetical protein